MAAAPPPRPHEAPNAGAETIPPGATRQAQDRPTTPPARGPNDPTGDKAFDKTPTIDAPPGAPKKPTADVATGG